MSVTVDCKGIASVKQFWDRYERAASVENCGFGRNLDALWDALEGGGPGWPDTNHLAFINSRHMEDFEDGMLLLNALREMATKLTLVKVEFV